MAQTTPQTLEREYIIPLRSEWRKTANYRRAGIAIRTIKRFIARHMKVPEHDVEKVKLDIYLNNEIFFKGRRKPPAKIKVKAIKEGELVKVSLAEIPEQVKFLQQKHEKLHKVSEKTEKTKEIKEKAPEEQEEKKAETDKEKAVAEQRELQAREEAKAQKHTAKPDKQKSHPTRMALQK